VVGNFIRIVFWENEMAIDRSSNWMRTAASKRVSTESATMANPYEIIGYMEIKILSEKKNCSPFTKIRSVD
jgi:hypothetical protein